jgi:hypothetical protein
VANKLKYSTSPQSNTLKKGNFWIEPGNIATGPTSITGYHAGLVPPAGGYVVYLYKTDGKGPSVYVATTDSELVSLTKRLAGNPGLTTIADCLGYYLTQSDKMCFNLDYERIVVNGLVLDLDFGFTSSYPQSGTTAYDISLNASNGVLVNSPTFNSEGKGNLVLDGVDDYADFNAPSLTTTATVEMWCKVSSSYNGKMFCGWQGYDIYCAGAAIGYNTGNSDVYGIPQATVDSLNVVDRWAHYVFEFRSDVSYTNNKIYINGVQQTLTQILGSESPSGRNFSSGNGRIASWGYGGYYMPMNLGSFRVYNRSLTQAEITQNYNAQKGRYVNFFTNGDFKNGNFNFTSGTANSSVTYDGAPYSLQMPQVHYSTFLSNALVEVDTSKNYQYTVVTRTLTKGGAGDNILSGGHQGFICYDSSQRFIDLRMGGGTANTYLTRDLNPGDAYAYVSNQNNQWFGAGGESYYWIFRHFMVYPPSHPEFHDKWRYTRIGYGDINIVYNEVTDIGGGELRIRFYDGDSTWTTFPDIGYPTPAGTAVCNGRAGGTFNYVFYPAEGAYGSWNEYTYGPFTGESSNSGGQFRFGTKYVSYMHLINYSVPGGTSPLPVMLIGKAELKQIL